MKQLESFGKYTLLERLAAGGMAEVFLAKSIGAGGISKFVAVKRILPQYSDNAEFIEMFKEEARIAMNLSHSNVVSIYDFGVEQRQFFLVMEYVEGQNLRQILNHMKTENKEFSVEQILYMVKQAAAGLDHAHRCIDSSTGRPLNITHRDMSPQNIMVSFEGEVKIVDFGIAKAESQLENTRAGTIKGKFGYMSPEQAEGNPVDVRTDIFSLGIVLWELLAQDRLFTASSEAATLRKIRDCQIPQLHRINPRVPPELERICNKALAKDLSLRYQTSAAFHRDLNRFLNIQYPEFSPQDFSVFMKSAFSKMYLDNKKKHVEYAKAQGVKFKDRPVENVPDSTTITQTLTDSKQKQEQEEDANFLQMSTPDESTRAESSPKIDLKQFKIKEQTFNRRNNGPSGRNHNSNPSIRKDYNYDSNGPAPSRSSMGGGKMLWAQVVIAFIALTAVFVWWSRNPSVVAQWTQSLNQSMISLNNHPNGPVSTPESKHEEMQDLGSTQLYAVMIDSVPSGARIYIDGRDTGTKTPNRRSLEANKEVKIGLSRDGFSYFEKVEKITQDGQSIRATLQVPPPMGYISITVVNGGSDPVVYINDQRVNQKPPIRLYGIPANTPVKVRVQNPFTQLAAEKTVVVGVSEKKEMSLLLTRAATER